LYFDRPYEYIITTDTEKLCQFPAFIDYGRIDFMDTPEVIAKNSLKFLETLIDIDQTVAPSSALPYPKGTMEKEMLDHVTDLVQSAGGTPEARAHLRLAYASLAGCVDDADAALMEKVENILEKAKIQLDEKRHMDEETKRAFLDHGGTESEVARYISIISDIERERQKLISAFDIELDQDSISVSN
jgi:uncharacterized OsmC-like protein